MCRALHRWPSHLVALPSGAALGEAPVVRTEEEQPELSRRNPLALPLPVEERVVHPDAVEAAACVRAWSSLGWRLP